MNRRHQDCQSWTRNRGSTQKDLPCNQELLRSSCAGVLWSGRECVPEGHNSGTLRLIRPDAHRLRHRHFSSPGSTQVNRHEALALRFQGLSSVAFEGCPHSVARTSQARLVVPSEPFDATSPTARPFVAGTGSVSSTSTMSASWPFMPSVCRQSRSASNFDGNCVPLSMHWQGAHVRRAD